jgi:hypothetical protein
LVKDWARPLGTIHDEGPEWCVPFLLDVTHPEDAEVLEDRIEDRNDPLDIDDLFTVATTVIEQATGTMWWVACRIITSLRADWNGWSGTLALEGIDLWPLLNRRPAHAIAIVRAFRTMNTKKEDLDQFNWNLELPPSWLSVDKIVDESQLAADAMAFLALAGVKGTK